MYWFFVNFNTTLGLACLRRNSYSSLCGRLFPFLVWGGWKEGNECGAYDWQSFITNFINLTDNFITI